MLYDLIQTYKGREKIMMTDEKAKVEHRKQTLMNSQKGLDGVTYAIKRSAETVPYKRPANTSKTKKELQEQYENDKPKTEATDPKPVKPSKRKRFRYKVKR